MSTDNRPRTATVVLERTYRASLADVWELWTTKEGFESWWGPQGFRADVHELDARVGGVLRYDMVADSAEAIAAMKKMGAEISHPVRSTFAELVPRTRLVMRNVVDFLPGVAPYENDVVVDLSTNGEHVTMRVTIGGMHAEEWNTMQKEGMTSQLTKLDARFAATS
jgi:uncharacterized protein YndB with AHSA1/START domain